MLHSTIPSSFTKLTALQELYVGLRMCARFARAPLLTIVCVRLCCRDLSHNAIEGDLQQYPDLQQLPIRQGRALEDNEFDCPLPSWAAYATPCISMCTTRLLNVRCSLLLTPLGCCIWPTIATHQPIAPTSVSMLLPDTPTLDQRLRC
jgi:hypothetical protein